MSQKIRENCLKIYEAYLYGTGEKCVMFTLIYFNRSQHAIALQTTFKRAMDLDRRLKGLHASRLKIDKRRVYMMFCAPSI